MIVFASVQFAGRWKGRMQLIWGCTFLGIGIGAENLEDWTHRSRRPRRMEMVSSTFG